ncbi:hypothetical protein WMY93_011978 [Mugilogobius chulae]|uniref:Uncharacterized protein n=1 Tax=Mugilogobius chulae TaxID=88201 RepID=A0AAW0P7L1_9GOBI
MASTAPRDLYSTDYCLDDWDVSLAYLAIPILMIMLVNMALLSVVLYKIIHMVNRGTDERAKLGVRLFFLLISFVLFGVTRGLAMGTIISRSSLELYIAFAVFTSLEGVWILVFGPFYDSKIRLILCKKCHKEPAEQQ